MKHIPAATIGLDLAKNVFQVHGADAQGRKLFNKPIRRDKLAEFFQLQTPCIVAMEACASANHWARKFKAMGHDVRLIAPQHVKPYVQGSKHDAADASAICEAVTRPRMRFVPIKNIEQQADLSLHRARQSFIKARTAQDNQIRGFLAEYGLILPKGISQITSQVFTLIEDASNELPGRFRILINTLLEHFKQLHQQVLALDAQIKASSKSPLARKLQTIPGIGPITASALVASIGDPSAFKNGRQLAAWLGLVPAQHSSGGKTHMQGISKRGDSYLRSLLVHGARSVIWSSEKKRQAVNTLQGRAEVASHNRLSTDLAARQDLGLGSPQEVDQGGGIGLPALPQHQAWLAGLLQRRHANVATVALAAKNARIVWAILKGDRNYEAGYVDPRFAKAAA
jgi:transposase